MEITKPRIVWDMSLLNNFLFPLIVSFLGLNFALQYQACNSKKSDRKREIQYLHSLKADLVSDLKSLDRILTEISVTTDGLDTALEQMQKPMTTTEKVKLNYILIMKYDWFPSKVNFNEGTISQLKSTGGLTLITDSELADSISVYDVGIRQCHKDIDIVLDSYKETFTTQKYVYNYRDRLIFQIKMNVENSNELRKYSNDTLVKTMDNNIKMLTDDKNKIVACYNDFANYQASLELYYKSLLRQKQITVNLLSLLKKKENI